MTFAKKGCLAVGTLMLLAAVAYSQQKYPVVGGREMLPTRNIVQNAVNSADHTTLVAAVKAAGLVDTLEGPRAVHRLCSDK